ncbi:uncharacterized protein LOC142358127 isoform X2 [Convolutriloba macropyga]|uniref:uncharacterized protein LOC142358127 isoform X2 n=1 Tax=Convolutriloba macropyga TaxID=536237 RepID=UPI003F51FE7D
MANTANSFAALLGAGGEAAVNSGSKNKKKKNKGKKGGVHDGNVATAVESPVVSASIGKSGAPQSHQAPATVGVEDAVKHIEKAARNTPPEECSRLWNAWIFELEAVKAGRGVQYTGSSGLALNFQQVLVKSSALELAAEAAVLMETNTAQDDLARLFSLSFPPSADFLPETFAELVFRLGHVSAADSAVCNSTKKAVRSAVAALKGGSSNEVADERLWLQRLAELDAAISMQDTSLRKLAQRPSTHAVLKEQVEITAEMVRLSDEKLGLLRSGRLVSGCPPPQTTESASAAIRELRSLLQGLVASTPKKGNRRSSKDMQGLQKRQAALKEAIRTAETQLANLRMELSHLEGQMGGGMVDQVSSSFGYERQLDAADALGALVQRSWAEFSSIDDDGAADLRLAEMPSALLSTVERNLQALLALQDELLQSLQSAMDKLSRNRRQARLLADMDGADAAIASHRKVREDLERMLDKIQGDSEMVLQRMGTTLESLESKRDTMQKLPGHASRIPFYRGIDSLAERIRTRHQEILASLTTEIAEDDQKPKSRFGSMPLEQLSPDERVRLLEEQLKAATGLLQHKDAELAKLAKQALPSGNGAHATSQPREESLSTVGGGVVATAAAPVIAPAIGGGVLPTGAGMTADPVCTMVQGTVQPQMAVAAAVVAEPAVSPPKAAAARPLTPKAAPRGWGKVDVTPQVLDESLPSLAESMATSGKGKRSHKR